MSKSSLLVIAAYLVHVWGSNIVQQHSHWVCVCWLLGVGLGGLNLCSRIAFRIFPASVALELKLLQKTNFIIAITIAIDIDLHRKLHLHRLSNFFFLFLFSISLLPHIRWICLNLEEVRGIISSILFGDLFYYFGESLFEGGFVVGGGDG